MDGSPFSPYFVDGFQCLFFVPSLNRGFRAHTSCSHPIVTEIFHVFSSSAQIVVKAPDYIQCFLDEMPVAYLLGLKALRITTRRFMSHPRAASSSTRARISGVNTSSPRISNPNRA